MKRRASTHASCKRLIDNHINPKIGGPAMQREAVGALERRLTADSA